MKKLSLTLALILIAATLGCVQTGIAFAASETVYTGVLEDLQKDETFDVAAYPAKTELSDKDKVMDVIQIAESNAGELFLYVYQPQAGKFTATEVRISQSVDDVAPTDYKLTLLDRDGALEKYKVEQLQLKSDTVRYYFILQLARPWDKQLDNGNIADTVPYGIEKLFTVESADDKITYTEEHKDCIELVNKYVGNLRYYNGGIWMEAHYTSSHYVAFTTDIPIDTIYEVDLKYNIQEFSNVGDYAYNHWTDENADSTLMGPYFTGDKIPQNVTLTSKEYTTYKNPWDYFLHKTHTWNSIQSKDEFISSENLDPSVKDKLEDKQWVLRFATSDIIKSSGELLGYHYRFSEVSDVTLLRLNFISKGKVYNLGVVDNKQTGGSVTQPDNPGDDNSLDGVVDRWEAFLEKLEAFWNNVLNAFKWLAEHWWFIIIGIVVIALIVWLIIAIVKKGAAVVFKAVGVVLWWVLKIIFYIVTLPVWLIIWGVRAIKKGRDRNG